MVCRGGCVAQCSCPNSMSPIWFGAMGGGIEKCKMVICSLAGVLSSVRRVIFGDFSFTMPRSGRQVAPFLARSHDCHRGCTFFSALSPSFFLRTWTPPTLPPLLGFVNPGAPLHPVGATSNRAKQAAETRNQGTQLWEVLSAGVAVPTIPTGFFSSVEQTRCLHPEDWGPRPGNTNDAGDGTPLKKGVGQLVKKL